MGPFNTSKLRITIVIFCIAILLMTTVVYIHYAQVVAQRATRENSVIMGFLGSPVLNWNILALGGSSAMERGAWQYLYPPNAPQNTYFIQWFLFLIDRIEINGEEATITFHIRDEARWSDGRPITADDYIQGYALSRQVGAGLWGQWCTYNYEKIDDKTIKYYLARAPGESLPPREELPTLISEPWGCIVFVRPIPVHQYQPIVDQYGAAMATQWRNEDPKQQVVSSFLKLYYASEEQVIYEVIENWWGKDLFGVPPYKFVVHYYFKDNTMLLNAVIEGYVDLTWAAFAPNPVELLARGLKLWNDKPPYFIPGAAYWLYFNHNHPVLNRVEVRKAIAWALPWEDITKYALYNLVPQAPILGIVAEGYWKDYVNREACQKYWGTPECLLKQNLAKAKEILDQAGIIDKDGDGVRELPDGTKCSFKLLVPAGAIIENNIADLIRQALKEIGITVYLEVQESKVLWDNFRNSNFDSVIMWSAAGYEYGHVRNSYGNALYAPWGNMARWCNYNNDRLNALFDEMYRRAMFKEDEIILAGKIQEIIFEELPSIPLYYSPLTWIYNTKYWDGWPNAQRPWWLPTFYNDMPMLLFVRRSGEPIEAPWWYKSVEDGGALVSYDLLRESLKEAVIEVQNFVYESGKPEAPTPTVTVTGPSPTTPSPTPTTTPTITVPGTELMETIVKTITTTTMITVTSVTTISTTVKETEWTTPIVVAIVALVIGFAISWFVIKKK
ncbi:MAG: ABC transporter substrate-binding protein [Ignisphaera sp.]|uniref:Solute-binding protein family 5 domain-containing protein n=1 Tax=Ignisphaera aggregans TaxID=334771 RepID=A0A832FVY6_9CREN